MRSFWNLISINLFYDILNVSKFLLLRNPFLIIFLTFLPFVKYYTWQVGPGSLLQAPLDDDNSKNMWVQTTGSYISVVFCIHNGLAEHMMYEFNFFPHWCRVTKSHCESQACPKDLITPPDDCHVNYTLSFSLQVSHFSELYKCARNIFSLFIFFNLRLIPS